MRSTKALGAWSKDVWLFLYSDARDPPPPPLLLLVLVDVLLLSNFLNWGLDTLIGDDDGKKAGGPFRRLVAEFIARMSPLAGVGLLDGNSALARALLRGGGGPLAS